MCLRVCSAVRCACVWRRSKCECIPWILKQSTVFIYLIALRFHRSTSESLPVYVCVFHCVAATQNSHSHSHSHTHTYSQMNSTDCKWNTLQFSVNYILVFACNRPNQRRSENVILINISTLKQIVNKLSTLSRTLAVRTYKSVECDVDLDQIRNIGKWYPLFVRNLKLPPITFVGLNSIFCDASAPFCLLRSRSCAFVHGATQILNYEWKSIILKLNMRSKQYILPTTEANIKSYKFYWFIIQNLIHAKKRAHCWHFDH